MSPKAKVYQIRFSLQKK